MPARSPSSRAQHRSPPGGGAPVLLFDAECPRCDAFVEFVAARDRGRFTFAPLASAYGQRLAAGLSPDAGPIVLVEGDHLSVGSEAVFGICRHLRRGWPLAALGRLLPRRMTDAVMRRVLGSPEGPR